MSSPYTKESPFALPIPEKEPVKTRTFLLQDSILDRITDGFAVVDRKWTILYVNKEAERIASRPRADLLGKNIWDACPEYVGTSIDKNYHLAMTTGKSVTFEEYLPHFNEWFITSVYPSADGLSIYFRDITERKLAESLSMNAMEELKATKRELERSNEMLEQYAAVACHDLKAPLKVISFYLYLLKKRLIGGTDRDSEIYAETALTSADRLSSLVQSLFSFCSVSKNKVNYGRVDLAKVLAETLSDLKLDIESANASIKVSKNLPVVQGSHSQIGQVFQNLVGNAVKYRSPERRLQILIKYQLREEEHQFTIIDNGMGFSQQYAEEIFKLFRRLPSQTDACEGSGIGLSITKQIIESHGGIISAESVPGKGSEFFFTLPARGLRLSR